MRPVKSDKIGLQKNLIRPGDATGNDTRSLPIPYLFPEHTV